MKKLIFDELLLLSVINKRARRIKFHPRCTVISGDNETGKSAIVKSLYAAFGASPPVIDQAWKNAEVTTLLRFSIEGRRYAILRESEAFTLFNPDDKVIGVYRHIREGLATKLSELFDFKLHFYTSSGEGRSAHPAYLFAPFYVDQDRGWSNPWAAFKVVKSSRRLDAIEYHVGIRPNSYFEAKARLQELNEELVLPEQELSTLRRILSDLGDRVSNSAIVFNTESFQAEVESLVRECQQLREREEAYRERVLRLENERLSLETQTGLMEKAADELRKDYKFAMRQSSDVECPMCGAHYENSIVERFDIAQDEDRCVNFMGRLDQEVTRVDEQMRTAREQFSTTNSEIDRINELLETRRQQLSLREVIQAEGQRELREKVVADITTLEEGIDKLGSSISQSKRDMREATDKKRRKEIKQSYARLLQDIAVRLAVSPSPTAMMKSVAPTVIANGSDMPRRLLAYYVALLHTIHRNTSGLYAPFVVDAVNQQDQENENLSKMLEILSSGLPEDTQLILSCVDTKDASFEGTQIKLTDKRSVLRVEEYDDVASEVRPLIEARFEAERAER